jgi:hypothetical protein
MGEIVRWEEGLIGFKSKKIGEREEEWQKWRKMKKIRNESRFI